MIRPEFGFKGSQSTAKLFRSALLKSHGDLMNELAVFNRRFLWTIVREWSGSTGAKSRQLSDKKSINIKDERAAAFCRTEV